MSDLTVRAMAEQGKYYLVQKDANGNEVRMEVDKSVFDSVKNAGNPENKAPAKHISEDDFNIPGLTIEKNPDEAAQPKKLTGLDAGSIEEGETMRTKQEYKQMKRDAERAYKEDFADITGFKEKDINKAAKRHAKNQEQITKAADKVLSSHYYTTKEEYKAAKKANPEGRHVLLSKDDLKLLQDKKWDGAFDGRERDEKGNITKEGTLNDSKLKQISAERIGMDNELEMEERISETAAHADEVGLKDGKVTHRKARKAKNLYKHLGYDYQKDLTEVKKAAYVVATTAAGALAGNLIAKNTNPTGTGIAPGGEKVVPGQTINGTVVDVVKENGIITSIKEIPYTVTTEPQIVKFGSQAVSVVTKLSGAGGAGLGSLIGLGVGLATMGKINDFNKKNDILQGMDALDFVKGGDVKGIKKTHNQIMMADTLKMAKEKGLTDGQIAAAIVGARGENNCLTEKELNTLHRLVKAYEPAPAEEPTEAPTTPPIETPTEAPTEAPTPEPHCHETQEKDIYAKMKTPKYRTGVYYLSHAYVNEDGSNLSPADRKALQNELRKRENRVAKFNDPKSEDLPRGIQLRNEITLPSGKVVKIADNAYERIMAEPAHGGGSDPKYETARHGTMFRPVDCKTKQPLAPWMTEEQYEKWEEAHSN